MTLAIAAPDLTDTVTARWYRRGEATSSGKRSHWRTKRVYFRSVCRLLEERPGTLPGWKSVVDAARPQGSRSTFYEVAGPHARHALMTDLIDAATSDTIALALSYRRTDAVASLIDEAKVWSFWPYRERVAARFTAAAAAPADMEAMLRTALTEWAARVPALARSLDFAPPICAVEDLTVVLEGQMAAMRVTSLLTAVLRRTF